MTITTTPAHAEPGNLPHGVAGSRSLFDRQIMGRALIDAFKKLDPRVQIKNPVMFVGLTIGVIIIIGGLTFFPAVSLGPIVEQLSHGKFF